MRETVRRVTFINTMYTYKIIQFITYVNKKP